MKLTLLLLLASFASAQTSAPVRPSAGDPQHLLPTAPITIHSINLSAYEAYFFVAKLLGVDIWLAPTNVHTLDGKPHETWGETYQKRLIELKSIHVKLNLENVSASEALDAIASASHQVWEVWPNPKAGPVLVVVRDLQPQ